MQMPRSRGSEMPQKQSPRAPLHLKTTACSEANGTHRSPRLDDRRSPRSPLHEVQKKRGTRVADLETKLGQAQDELKKLKEQLVTAEAAKRDAQQELEETKKLIPVAADIHQGAEEEVETLPLDSQEKANPPVEEEELTELEPGSEPVQQTDILDSPDADVLKVEVPTDVILTEPPPAHEDDEGKTGKAVEEIAEKEVGNLNATIEEDGKDGDKAAEEGQESKVVEIPGSLEVTELIAKLEEKDKELELLKAENENLRKQATEAEEVKAREEELGVKLGCMENELRECKAKAELLEQQLEAVEKAKAMLETEMRRLRVQMDQWRKAAETAAAVLNAGGEMGSEANGRRASERCGSMDKHLGYDLGGGGFVGLGSPMMSEEEEEGLGGGKRRGTAIRMFGDLWRKRGQQK